MTTKPPLPPFNEETAIKKVRLAENAWNTKDPVTVSLAYTEDSFWRNRSEFIIGRAEIVEKHATLWIGTSSGKIECPTKVRFTTGFIAAKLRAIKDYSVARPTKKSLWHRDAGECQYCSKNVTISNATIDHVIPKSKGGGHTWENLVIACSKCNGKKGDRLLTECNMTLKDKPGPPKENFLPVLV